MKKPFLQFGKAKNRLKQVDNINSKAKEELNTKQSESGSVMGGIATATAARALSMASILSVPFRLIGYGISKLFGRGKTKAPKEPEKELKASVFDKELRFLMSPSGDRVSKEVAEKALGRDQVTENLEKYSEDTEAVCFDEESLTEKVKESYSSIKNNEADDNELEERTREAARKVNICRHLAAEQKQLAEYRTKKREAAPGYIRNALMPELEKEFATDEEKNSLREWFVKRNDTGSYETNASLYDPAHKQGGYTTGVLDRVEKTSVDTFLYDDDSDFVSSFAEKYDQLCRMASADVILDKAEAFANGNQLSDQTKLTPHELRAKIEFCKQMKEHYEDKMKLMSSPHYILLQSGDIEFLKKEENISPELSDYLSLYEKVYNSDLSKTKKAKKLYDRIKLKSSETQAAKDVLHTKRLLESLNGMKDSSTDEDEDDDNLGLENKGDIIIYKVFKQQKKVVLDSFPKDDMEFVKKVEPTAGLNLVEGMDTAELIPLEKIIMEDIYQNGTINGQPIEERFLSEMREHIKEFVENRRQYLAELKAAEFASQVSDGGDMDLTNPKFKKTKEYKKLSKYITGKFPEAIRDKVEGETKARYSQEGLFKILGMMLNAGYNVFPETEKKVEEKSKGYTERERYADKEERKGKLDNVEFGTFMVNGKERLVLSWYHKDDYKNIVDKAYQVEGEQGAELERLLDERQRLIDKIYFVAVEYGNESGAKNMVRQYYETTVTDNDLMELDKKITDILKSQAPKEAA